MIALNGTVFYFQTREICAGTSDESLNYALALPSGVAINNVVTVQGTDTSYDVVGNSVQNIDIPAGSCAVLGIELIITDSANIPAPLIIKGQWQKSDGCECGGGLDVKEWDITTADQIKDAVKVVSLVEESIFACKYQEVIDEDTFEIKLEASQTLDEKSVRFFVEGRLVPFNLIQTGASCYIVKVDKPIGEPTDPCKVELLYRVKEARCYRETCPFYFIWEEKCLSFPEAQNMTSITLSAGPGQEINLDSIQVYLNSDKLNKNDYSVIAKATGAQINFSDSIGEDTDPCFVEVRYSCKTKVCRDVWMENCFESMTTLCLPQMGLDGTKNTFFIPPIDCKTIDPNSISIFAGDGSDGNLGYLNKYEYTVTQTEDGGFQVETAVSWGEPNDTCNLNIYYACWEVKCEECECGDLLSDYTTANPSATEATGVISTETLKLCKDGVPVQFTAYTYADETIKFVGTDGTEVTGDLKGLEALGYVCCDDLQDVEEVECYQVTLELEPGKYQKEDILALAKGHNPNITNWTGWDVNVEKVGAETLTGFVSTDCKAKSYGDHGGKAFDGIGEGWQLGNGTTPLGNQCFEVLAGTILEFNGLFI